MESELSADKKVEQLSEEELHCVLKQLTDHNIPEREKCPLVQRLNAEDALASNNTSYSSLLPPTSARSSNHSSVKLRSRLHVLSNENELDERSLTQPNHTPQSHSQPHCRDKPANYAQTLQELRTNNNCDDSQNLPAAISNSNTEIVATASHLRSGGSNRKPNRANSFTMPSQSDNNSNKSDSTFKILDHRLTNGTEVSRESLSIGDKQTLNGSSSMSNHKSSSSAINCCAPQSCSNSSHYLLSDIADHNHSSYKSSSSKFSSIHLNSIETLVNRLPFTSDTVSSNYPRFSTERGALNKSKELTVQEEDEEKPQFCEMKDLHSNFDIVQYRDINSSLKDQQNSNSERHNVDKTLEMPMLTNNNEENTYPYQNFNQFGNFANNPNATTTNGNRGTKKKKRAPDVVRKSEHVEGYVGYIQDVDYLESFVNNTSSSNNGSMNNFDKKNKGKTQKHENEIGKRTKRNNGEIKLNNDGYKGVFSTKLALSNSSSLSGDEAPVVKNGILAKPNTSPEVFNSNGTKSKKGKSKNKQDKNINKANNERENLSFDKTDSNKHRKDDNVSLSRDEANCNSSSNATDSEEDQPMEYFPRSKKSNSLLPTQTVILPEDDNLHTVSDSEMADREKGFVTPKNKYFKKKKIQQSRFQPHESSHNSSQKQSSSKNLPYNSNGVGVHNLGRGYESEREYSLNNCINPNSFTSQSLSSSMLAINSRVSDRRLLSNLSPPTKEESPPILSESTDLLDNEFMPQLVASDTYDCGPKIPSYADIAKSYYHPSNTIKGVTTCMKQPSDNSSTIEEFPQLDSRSPFEPTIDFLNGNLKINLASENIAFKPVSTSKIDSPNKEDSCRKDKVSTPNATSIIQEEPEMNDKSDSVNISTLSDIQINHQNESPAKSDIPVIIYGKEDNSNIDMKSTFNCDQLTENCINGTLSFGFFDESEISMFREAEFSPLDQNFYNSQFDSDLQSKQFENIEINGHVDLNEIQMCENANFYKNAVHVNVLEKQYFRKLDDQDDCVHLQSENNKAAYSSSTSSPLSSSFDSSPASSAAVSSSSVLSNSNSSNETKSDKPFVSCVSTLGNLKFIDNVDLCSFNYKKVIQYVYDSWEQFKSL